MDKSMKRPNFLLVFPDQHRGDWTELNNKLPVRTPNIKKMARYEIIIVILISVNMYLC